MCDSCGLHHPLIDIYTHCLNMNTMRDAYTPSLSLSLSRMRVCDARRKRRAPHACGLNPVAWYADGGKKRVHTMLKKKESTYVHAHIHKHTNTQTHIMGHCISQSLHAQLSWTVLQVRPPPTVHVDCRISRPRIQPLRRLIRCIDMQRKCVVSPSPRDALRRMNE